MYEEIYAETICYRILLRMGYYESTLEIAPRLGVKYQIVLNAAIARLHQSEG